MTSKAHPKNEFISRVLPLVAPLVAQTAFVIKKWAPSAPKVLPSIDKLAKHDTKELPEYENELQKWTLFGARRK